MADQDRDEGPSLELPSFGFRRKRRKKRAAAQAEPTPQPEPVPEPEPSPPPHAEPVREPEPLRDSEPEAPPAPEAPEAPAAAEPEPIPEPEPTPEPEPEPTPEPAPVTREAPHEPTPVAAATSGRPLFTEDQAPTGTTLAADEDRTEEAPAEPKKKKKKVRKPLRVGIGAVPGAMITGLVVGLVTVGLTWGALNICEFIRGAASCGGNGLWVLLLILVAMIFFGAWMLRVFRVSDPGSTSFLAVGLLTVVALLFLVDVMFNWWMIIVIPCVTLLTYTLSSWVTTSFVDEGRG